MGSIIGCQSTLYGSGAIAGLINLVTKDPGRERELSFLLNGTSALGLDLNGYYSQRFGKTGLTVYATHNRQKAFDPNNDQFSDLPQTVRTTFQPKFWFYPNETTTVSLGLNYSGEQRTGGFIPALTTPGAGYTEVNNSQRWSTQFRLDKRFQNSASLTIKNSYSQFRRSIILPGTTTDAYRFDGLQRSSFTEASYSRHFTKTDWIVGLNVWTDDFGTPQPNQSIQPRDRAYNQQIAGVFLQNTVSLSDQFSLETGLRSDVLLTVVPTGSDVRTPRAFLLPRFSLLYRANEHWSSRLGGGLGYKAPTVFTEEAERQLFYRVALKSIDQLQSERSFGANWDINYRVELADETTLSINQLFFYTRLNDPLTLMQINQQYQFKNAGGHIDTRGFETNIRFVWKELHAFLGYSFIDTKRHYDGLNDVLPLTARHRLYLTTLYESDRLKTGFEAFYVGRQQRNDGSTTRPFCTMGYMIERKWQWGSVFINFENFLDVRQSRYESLVQGTAQNPQFVTDIYAPTDGRVINAGIKLKL